MDNLEVGIIQQDIIWEDTQANLNHLQSLLSRMNKSVDLLVLPEMFHCGFTMEPEKVALSDRQVVDWMRFVAQDKQCFVMGSVVEKVKGLFVNRLYVVGEGDEWYYDKRHLFRMGGEHEKYRKGHERIVVNIKGWRVCPMICYDLRFPVWSRNQDDYDILVYVANWPSPRREVWNALLKARALENQAYVIGVNRTGKDRHCLYSGDSQVINEKGECLVKMNDEEDISYTSLSLDSLNAFRNKFPVWKDRDDFDIIV